MSATSPRQDLVASLVVSENTASFAMMASKSISRFRETARIFTVKRRLIRSSTENHRTSSASPEATETLASFGMLMCVISTHALGQSPLMKSQVASSAWSRAMPATAFPNSAKPSSALLRRSTAV